MKPWDFSMSAAMDRNGKHRSVDVCAKRYADGAFIGCVRAPSQRGHTQHTVEVSPRESKAVRELMGDTASALRSAFAAQRSGRAIVGHTWDLVGHTWDLVGRVAPTSAGATVNGCRDCWDVVGFDLSQALGGFRAATSNAGTQIQSGSAGSAALQGAMQGLLTGGASGAATGAVQSFGEQTGLASLARTIGTPIQEAIEAPPDGPVQSPADAQRRRNRAIRELLMVVDLPSHSGSTGAGGLSLANWTSAVLYHRRNGGLTSTEQRLIAPQGAPLPGGLSESDTAARRRAAVERLDPRAPLIADDGVTLLPVAQSITRDLLNAARASTQIQAGYPYPWPASATQSPLVDVLTWAYANPEASRLQAPSLVLAPSLPGVAGSQVSSGVPATTAGATLGATELLARALASIALERGSSSQEVQGAAQLLSSALRSVDAIAGARASDPRAREALRSAVNAGSARLASALRVGLALVGP